MEHDERLTVPWWGWLLTLAVTAALSVPFGLGAPIPVVRWLAFAATPVVAVALWWLGRIRVVVTPEELLVDDARLPRRFIAKAVPLDAAGKAALLGPRAEPLAFVVQRPWIPGAVQVVLNDPADPTPYWLVSTRQPARLARLLDPGAEPAQSADRGNGNAGRA
ncbi:MAG TPA: DUF3093 domain-containing protein [Natronosporangium sp.]